MKNSITKFRPEIQKCIRIIEERWYNCREIDYEECQKLLSFASDEGDDFLFGTAYFYLSNHYILMSEYDYLAQSITEGMKYYKNAKLYSFLARAYNTLGTMAVGENNLPIALENYYICLNYTKKYNLPYEHAMVLGNIAGILYTKKDYQKSLELYKEAELVIGNPSIEDSITRNMVLILIGQGKCYLMLDCMEEAKNLEKRIKEHLIGLSDNYIPQVGLNTFYAKLAFADGENELALEYLINEIDEFEHSQQFIEFPEIILENFEQLVELKAYPLLNRMMDFMEKCFNQKGNKKFVLEIYRIRLRYLSEIGDDQKYAQYAKKYFSLYEDLRLNAYDGTRKTLELSDKLYNIREKQIQMNLLHKKLLKNSLHDSMTGLPNRDYLNQESARLMEIAYKERLPLAVGIMDIDGFKEYNDTYGHMDGDECLNRIAEVLDEMRVPDKVFCARYGGDEFVVVYLNMEISELREQAEQLQNRIAELKIPGGYGYRMGFLSISLGIATMVPDNASRLWDYMFCADRLLYRVKRAGKNSFRIGQIRRNQEIVCIGEEYV